MFLIIAEFYLFFFFMVWKQDHKLIRTAVFMDRYIVHLTDVSIELSTFKWQKDIHTYLISRRVVCHWCQLHILDLDITPLERGSINTP